MAKSKPVNPWLAHASKTYATMKKKDKNVSYSDALKAAKKTYKPIKKK